MSSVNAPFGLRPAFKEGGTPVSLVVEGTIITAYGTGILMYAPVKIGTSGGIELAASGEALVGSFMGCQFTDSFNRRVVSNQWPAAQAGTNIVAWYTKDPYITYEIQSNATVAQDKVGGQADTGTATDGNTTTGLSAVVLDAATIVQSAEFKQLRIVAFAHEIDDVVGDATDNPYPVLQVQISDHQYVAGRNAI